ncbi:MAG: DNA-directed RNA polymerase subunit beta' [Patescibacteria group bacterium]|nr:DNA-directed RNA polymerase subunit beta' [Patescibacteria group bacterium]MBU1987683.1 DNA-directed RNA polymerase subunit beta' [Patescibacteria group bacterium]
MLNPIQTEDFNAIKIKLASPEKILSWSSGEVTKIETINYRTQKPEKNGLFCERIFGPSKNWECYCGKYKKIRYKGIICDKCGVEITHSMVRRERFGHIELKSPCTHIWFLRGITSKIGLILNIGMQALEKIVYFANFIVTDVDENLKIQTFKQIEEERKTKEKSIKDECNKAINKIKNQKGESMQDSEKNDKMQADKNIKSEIEKLISIKNKKMQDLNNTVSQTQKELKELKPLLTLSEHNYHQLSLKYGHIFEAGIGTEAIKTLLEKINLDHIIKELEEQLKNNKITTIKKDKAIKRLKLFKNLKASNIRPEWMILQVIPVVPPDLRPMVALDGGRFATSDLNDLYRRIISRNNRLKQLTELNAPEVICRNEKRMLQEAVDALIDNSSRHSKTVSASTGQKRQLKSLADSLKGKQGRFRQNLLGKRTDYSGRSVIVVNPKLNLNQCGLPKTMAVELFKPFIISKLIRDGIVHNVRSASHVIDTGDDKVWEILENIVNNSYVLLNRAPTLHRLGIQAFQPILIEGKAIQIHPLVCSAFNADFDGDQMAVHILLTKGAIAEARDIMLSSHNLLKPATGDPVVAPSQDIILGIYYLTCETKSEKEKSLKHFSDKQEAILAYELKIIKLHELIKLRIEAGKLIQTTVGRIIFNNILPEKFSYINEVVKGGKLKELVKDCIDFYDTKKTALFLDKLKNKSFEFITKSGLSFSMNDLPDLKVKNKLISEADKQVKNIKNQYEEGLLTDSERYSKIVELWTNVKEKITIICKQSLLAGNPVHSMIESGARGSWTQLTQILGMKGLVTSPSGEIIELPIKGNFKSGFGALEYFISTHGVRKGLSDTALRTANAGYLTRRLVDVAQDVIITTEDCKDTEGLVIYKKDFENEEKFFFKCLTERFLAKDLQDKKNKTIAKAGDLITKDIINQIKNKNIEEVTIRSVLNCRLSKGICVKCYGYDLGRNQIVKPGTAVGIIAAQSIGEPGTQLTMRTFHTGGVASQEDITQGLPRVEEIFEVHPPKNKAIMAEVSGTVKIESEKKAMQNEKGKKIMVDNPAVKILKIYYKGTDSFKYSFSDAINKMKLKNSNQKNKKITANNLKLKILVKDGYKVGKEAELFLVGEKIFKSKHSGIVKIKEKHIDVAVAVDKMQEFTILKGAFLLIKDGDKVQKGDQLTKGSIDLRQLYELKGHIETQKYIIKEIQHVYAAQGQFLNNKHIEIIAKQMFSRYFILDSGNTDLLHGEIVDIATLSRANKKTTKKQAKANKLLLGITKASLSTDSFLSAASFQQTAQVLIDAAVSGKVDYLEGLKENVIIGRLIPAGTGYRA